jgi:hypothetical protein
VLDYSPEQFKVCSGLYKLKEITSLSTEDEIFEIFVFPMIHPMQEILSTLFGETNTAKVQTHIDNMWEFIETQYKKIEAKIRTSSANLLLTPEAARTFLGGGNLSQKTLLERRRASSATKG